MLEEKLESAKSTSSITEASFDIGSVFIEAKHSADNIITQAKNAAKKIERIQNHYHSRLLMKLMLRLKKLSITLRLHLTKLLLTQMNRQQLFLMDK